MIRILRLGDPHVKVSNLEESDKLMQFVVETALAHKVDRIEILGDLYHTHAILRLEVIEFWSKWLRILSDVCQVVVLVGNHDQSGDYNFKGHALGMFANYENKNLTIVDGFLTIQPFTYAAYYHDAALFKEHVNSHAKDGSKVLVCHQTFNGSTFENGFYAPDGMDPLELQFDTIISGHIHKQQRFGKVIYPGTARWDSVSDANQVKGIWIFEHDDKTGAILKEEFISTEGVCSPIVSLTWNEGEEFVPAWPANSRVAVELVGSSVWVNARKAELKGQCAIKTKYTDKFQAVNRSAGSSFQDFLVNLYAALTDKKRLLEYAKEIGIV